MSTMTGEAASCRPSAQDEGCPGAASALAALISKAPIVTAQARKRENAGICITAPVPLERADKRAQKFSDFAHARIGKPVPFFPRHALRLVLVTTAGSGAEPALPRQPGCTLLPMRSAPRIGSLAGLTGWGNPSPSNHKSGAAAMHSWLDRRDLLHACFRLCATGLDRRTRP